jgi:hypothetical protein
MSDNETENDTVTKLDCDKCNWSHRYTKAEMKDLGLPWYCGSCGERVYKFQEEEFLEEGYTRVYEDHTGRWYNDVRS